MKYNKDMVCQDGSHNKRQQILDAAYIIFSRKGYHKATVDEIIALADTGKGTVYNYFINKEQLFYTIIKERSASFEKALAQLAKDKEQPLAKVEKAIKLFLLFMRDNGDLWRVMMFEIRGLGDDSKSAITSEQGHKYRKWFSDNIGILAGILQEGILAQQFKECDPEKTAYGLFSVIVMLVFQKSIKDIDTAAHSVAETFLYGVAKK